MYTTKMYTTKMYTTKAANYVILELETNKKLKKLRTTIAPLQKYYSILSNILKTFTSEHSPVHIYSKCTILLSTIRFFLQI